MTNINIYLAGDSTVCNYDPSVAPRTGWGQVLNEFLNDDVIVNNHASSGRSSKSFIQEGRLDEITNQLQANDYLFIQFGHNDSKPDEERHTDPFTSFKANLNQFIQQARNKQAIPVLVTPVQRRSFNEDGSLIDTHGDYAVAIREVAQESDVPLIDLATHSHTLYEQLGPEKTKKLFLWFTPGEYLNYPDGIQDDTHFSEYGAREIAKLVIQSIQDIHLPLVTKLKS